MAFIYSLEGLDFNTFPSGRDIHIAKPLLTTCFSADLSAH